MKDIFRSLAISALSLYLTQQLIPSVTISEVDYFVIVSGLLFLVNFFIGPVSKILFFLPINYPVLILLHIFGNFLVLYFSSTSLEEVVIRPFDFSGFTGFGLAIRGAELTALQTMITAALSITLISAIFRWLAD